MAERRCAEILNGDLDDGGDDDIDENLTGSRTINHSICPWPTRRHTCCRWRRRGAAHSEDRAAWTILCTRPGCAADSGRRDDGFGGLAENREYGRKRLPGGIFAPGIGKPVSHEKHGISEFHAYRREIQIANKTPIGAKFDRRVEDRQTTWAGKGNRALLMDS
jgi:hypothetical protein